MGVGERNDVGHMAGVFAEYVVYLFFRLMEEVTGVFAKISGEGNAPTFQEKIQTPQEQGTRAAAIPQCTT